MREQKLDQASAELIRLHTENEAMSNSSSQIIADNVRLQELNQELLEALRMNAQALAWLAHGKCRGFHPKLPDAHDALEAARVAIAKGGLAG